MLEGDPRSLNGTKVGLGIAAVETSKNGFSTVLGSAHTGVKSPQCRTFPLARGDRASSASQARRAGKFRASAAALDDAWQFVVYNRARVPSPLGLVCFCVHLALYAPAQILGEAPPKSALALFAN